MRLHLGLALVASILAMPCAALAEEAWPSRPIHVIVPFGAGSVTDVAPRVVLDQLSRQLGQPIVVENKPGAGTTIGAAQVARAAPDGYTLLVNSSAHVVAPSIYANIPYDTVRDFAGIAVFGMTPNALIVSPDKGFKTLADLVAAAKSKPGAINFASVGVGSATHINAERFRLSASLDMLHIPFKGGPEALTEVMAGRVEFYFCPVGTALPLIKDGRLVALAVGSPKRSASLPDVPTTEERGFADSAYTIWIGILAPAKTPREIIDRLHKETMLAMQTPNVRARLDQLAVEPLEMTPAEFDKSIAEEIPGIAKVVKAAGIKAN